MISVTCPGFGPSRIWRIETDWLGLVDVVATDVDPLLGLNPVARNGVIGCARREPAVKAATSQVVRPEGSVTVSRGSRCWSNTGVVEPTKTTRDQPNPSLPFENARRPPVDASCNFQRDLMKCQVKNWCSDTRRILRRSD